jgi:hypothetical protein
VKGVFDKGYTPNWSTEVFEVYEAIPSNPPTYRIRDMKGQTIQGLFYEPELMSEYSDVEKVVKTKGNKLYVKWLGFDSSHNSLIDKTDLQS